MSDIYKIKVNENQQFELKDDDLDNLDYKIGLNNELYIIENAKNYKAEMLKSDFRTKTYKVRINGNLYQVQIKNELDLLIDKLGLTLKDKIVEGNSIAPMPGLILDVMVKEGQEVKEGDALVILEAMKMENVMSAPKDGLIKKVHVNKGDAVDKKQVLIEME